MSYRTALSSCWNWPRRRRRWPRPPCNTPCSLREPYCCCWPWDVWCATRTDRRRCLSRERPITARTRRKNPKRRFRSDPWPWFPTETLPSPTRDTWATTNSSPRWTGWRKKGGRTDTMISDNGRTIRTSIDRKKSLDPPSYGCRPCSSHDRVTIIIIDNSYSSFSFRYYQILKTLYLSITTVYTYTYIFIYICILMYNIRCMYVRRTQSNVLCIH